MYLIAFYTYWGVQKTSPFKIDCAVLYSNVFAIVGSRAMYCKYIFHRIINGSRVIIRAVSYQTLLTPDLTVGVGPLHGF